MPLPRGPINRPGLPPSIIVAGEPIAFPKATTGRIKVVTWLDDPSWSFEAARAQNANSGFYYPRKGKEGAEIRSIPELSSVIKKVVLHTDVSRTGADCMRALVQEGLSTHFIIDWDGTIYQCLDPVYLGLHAREANKDSIGIDLNNVLPNLAVRGHASETYPTDIDPRIQDPTSEFFRPKSKLMVINSGACLSYGYCDAQYEALIELLNVLIALIPSIAKNAPFDASGKVIPNVMEDFMGFSGVMAHWHISTERWDPGPGFDWDRMVAGINGENNAFPLDLGDGRDMTTLVARDKVEDRAEAYYANTDTAAGGYYPMGLYQNWHDGVHLHAPKMTPVRNMMDGYLVAAHFGRETALGSNNFVLLAHDLELPSLSETNRKTLKVFSLYMHLAPQEVDQAGPGDPEWLQKLHGVYREGGDDAGGQAPDLGAKPAEDRKKRKRDDDEDEEGPGFETRRSGNYPYLEAGPGLSALQAGQVAYFPTEEGRRIRVLAKEAIGRVGEFGPEDEREAMLHLELFADARWRDGIDMNKHGDFWVELEEDLSSDLVVDNEQLLHMIGTSATRLRNRRPGQVVLDPGDVEDFFSDIGSTGRVYLRRCIVRHISEWSEHVDWVSAIAKGQGWDGLMEAVKGWSTQAADFESGYFMEEIARYLPFIWLTSTVAENIGLESKDGIVYTFHPIYFLMWLTFRSARRIQVLSSGLSEAELRKAHEEELRRYQEEKGKRIRDENAEGIVEGPSPWEFDSDAASPEEAMEKWKELRFPNTWKKREEGEDEL